MRCTQKRGHGCVDANEHKQCRRYGWADRTQYTRPITEGVKNVKLSVDNVVVVAALCRSLLSVFYLSCRDQHGNV